MRPPKFQTARYGWYTVIDIICGTHHIWRWENSHSGDSGPDDISSILETMTVYWEMFACGGWQRRHYTVFSLLFPRPPETATTTPPPPTQSINPPFRIVQSLTTRPWWQEQEEDETDCALDCLSPHRYNYRRDDEPVLHDQTHMCSSVASPGCWDRDCSVERIRRETESPLTSLQCQHTMSSSNCNSWQQPSEWL